jgi:hypothetical protein
MVMALFLTVTFCRLVEVYRCFRVVIAVKIKAANTSEWSVKQTT